MSPNDSILDATLAAYADGELAPDDAARIEARIAQDPALAARVERLRALRRGLAAAFDGALAEPPPERLLEAIRRGGGAEVINLADRRERPRPSAPAVLRWGALAASLLLAFGLGRFAIGPLAPQSPIVASPTGGLVAQGALAAGLERQLASTQGAEAPLKIGVSFLAADGRYCRTFTLRQAKPVAGLACREPSGWRVDMAMPAAPEAGAPGGYQTAGDETPAPILDAVDAAIRGPPLDAAAEARARDAGWAARK
jgi:anti-sigma factor RsiW